MEFIRSRIDNNEIIMYYKSEDGKKIIEKNERDTAIIQRRSLRASKKLSKNTVLKYKHLIALRPCPRNAISPDKIQQVLGKKVLKNMEFHEHFTWKKIR